MLLGAFRTCSSHIRICFLDALWRQRHEKSRDDCAPFLKQPSVAVLIRIGSYLTFNRSDERLGSKSSVFSSEEDAIYRPNATAFSFQMAKHKAVANVTHAR